MENFIQENSREEWNSTSRNINQTARGYFLLEQNSFATGGEWAFEYLMRYDGFCGTIFTLGKPFRTTAIQKHH